MRASPQITVRPGDTKLKTCSKRSSSRFSILPKTENLLSSDSTSALKFTNVKSSNVTRTGTKLGSVNA